MKLNTKAQSIANPYTITLILVVIAIFSTAGLYFGQDLAADSSSSLNDESRYWVFNQSEFEVVNKNNNTNEEFWSSNNVSEGSAKDFTLEFQFYREESSKLRQVLQNVWNAPTFFVNGLNLDLSTWNWVIQLLNTLIWLIVGLSVWGFIRGRY